MKSIKLIASDFDSLISVAQWKDSSIPSKAVKKFAAQFIRPTDCPLARATKRCFGTDEVNVACEITVMNVGSFRLNNGSERGGRFDDAFVAKASEAFLNGATEFEVELIKC